MAKLAPASKRRDGLRQLDRSGPQPSKAEQDRVGDAARSDLRYAGRILGGPCYSLRLEILGQLAQEVAVSRRDILAGAAELIVGAWKSGLAQPTRGGGAR